MNVQGSAEHILRAGVAGLAELYRAGAVKPGDICDFYLSRIALHDGMIGAVIHLDKRGAAHAAEASTARWQANAPLSPIDGVPILVKANIAVRGWPWHAGVAAYRNRVATADAACVARLREAGAILLGLANMHEAAFGATNDNPAFGRTCNPWDVGRTPGGSSGGSAAAVAAGFCAAALGTDTLGSVRIPSAYCGIFGVKPQAGLIETSGLVPLCTQLDEVGVHTSSAEDAAILLRVLASTDHRVPIWPTCLTEFVWQNEIEVEPGQAAAIDQAVIRAQLAGLAIQDLSLPDFDVGALQRAALLIVECGALATHGTEIADNPDGFSIELRKMLAWAARQPQARIDAAHRLLAATATMLKKICTDGTVILAPTAPQQAFAWSAPVPHNQAIFTTLASIAHLAAISVPAGLWNGLPVAFQLVGRDVFELLPLAERLAVSCGFPAIKGLAR